jgi:hypothetical protein
MDPGAGSGSAAPSLAPAEAIGPFDTGYPEREKPRWGIPRWFISLVAYLISAGVGLGLGYYLIKSLFPGSRLPSLW